jgi:hypothetical protein
MISQKKIHLSKRVNTFILEGESLFGKDEPPSKRVSHHFEGRIEKGRMKGVSPLIRVNEKRLKS